jgi:hypothetical protein
LALKPQKIQALKWKDEESDVCSNTSIDAVARKARSEYIRKTETEFKQRIMEKIV